VNKSLLHSVFLSWHIYTKEKSLLKKYLKEVEKDENLAYTPADTQREYPEFFFSREESKIDTSKEEEGKSSRFDN